ncbi:hypothetical protein WMF11_16285 [Sorangium sp. So ce295]|uniref:hypothetical protein n=1 Tax=Sorangium sp. So ce295 TaxID=3133295 RepID=UPI003F606E48
MEIEVHEPARGSARVVVVVVLAVLVVPLAFVGFVAFVGFALRPLPGPGSVPVQAARAAAFERCRLRRCCLPATR